MEKSKLFDQHIFYQKQTFLMMHGGGSDIIHALYPDWTWWLCIGGEAAAVSVCVLLHTSARGEWEGGGGAPVWAGPGGGKNI